MNDITPLGTLFRIYQFVYYANLEAEPDPCGSVELITSNGIFCAETDENTQSIVFREGECSENAFDLTFPGAYGFYLREEIFVRSHPTHVGEHAKVSIEEKGHLQEVKSVSLHIGSLEVLINSHVDGVKVTMTETAKNE